MQAWRRPPSSLQSLLVAAAHYCTGRRQGMLRLIEYLAGWDVQGQPKAEESALTEGQGSARIGTGVKTQQEFSLEEVRKSANRRQLMQTTDLASTQDI